MRDLTELLPSDWEVIAQAEPAARRRADLNVIVKGPDGAQITLVFEAKRRLLPRDVPAVVSRLRSSAQRGGFADTGLVVVAPYLSVMARASLSALDASYIDSTGNILVRTQRPALFIKQDGAQKDPWPSDEALRSLKGRAAGRAVRALVDFRPPYGVRELANRANVSLGSLARTIDLLDRDGLITRDERGPIVDLDWEGVIRRWAQDYEVTTSNEVSTFLEPRGISALSAKLSSWTRGYAITGAFAAHRFGPVAPARLAAIYVDDVIRWSERLDLRPADSGANVWLLEPYDDVVFDRARTHDSIVCVSASQLAVDLLTGPGRDPAEGEELLTWMKANENAWRVR